ncbi:MAG: hypothetical protein LBG65_00295 [Puniceicoccales bacterium]|nr:hypothetical protein [Puniceicoccales bacterium]
MKRYHAVGGVYCNRKPKTDNRLNLPAAEIDCRIPKSQNSKTKFQRLRY